MSFVVKKATFARLHLFLKESKLEIYLAKHTAFKGFSHIFKYINHF